MECNIATNDIYVGAMLSTMYVYMPCISCRSRDWYKKRPNIENTASARATGSLGSKYL